MNERNPIRPDDHPDSAVQAEIDIALVEAEIAHRAITRPLQSPFESIPRETQVRHVLIELAEKVLLSSARAAMYEQNGENCDELLATEGQLVSTAIHWVQWFAQVHNAHIPSDYASAVERHIDVIVRQRLRLEWQFVRSGNRAHPRSELTKPEAVTRKSRTPNTETARRIDDFLVRVQSESGEVIPRLAISKVAGYTSTTEFFAFQREDADLSKPAKRAYNRTLSMSTSEFLATYRRKTDDR